MTALRPPSRAAVTTSSVLLSDPDDSVRAALSAALGSAPGLRVAGEAADAHETLARAAEILPDLVLVGGLEGPRLAGLVRRLLAGACPPRVVVLAAPERLAQCREALRAGAGGLLPRDVSYEDLLRVLPAVAAGFVITPPPAPAYEPTPYRAVLEEPSTSPRTVPAQAPARSGRETTRPVPAADRRLTARDVHDLLGRTLAAINRKGELAARIVGTRPDRARAELEGMLVLTRRSMAEVRALAGGSRIGDLASVLEGARSDLEGLGLRADVTRDPPALPWPVEDAFAWVVREAVANVIRHSDARTCAIEVRIHGRTARLRITNDGAGPRVSSSGTGLNGLALRLRAVGGTLVHGPDPGARFTVEAAVPLSGSERWRRDGDQGGPGRGRDPHQGGRC
ncbi:histidine kinase [Streptomyces sp. NPDC058739]|uniref:ATP-binding response regulator n=1 Tax=Streptomyces sp. NPDC058739 TaxID=3346618 RepID=UPI00368375EE